MSAASSTAFGLGVGVSALLAILAAPWALDLPALEWLFKPATTMLVLAYAWQRGRRTPLLRTWVLVGLSLSLVGDVALMWPQQGFLPGLVSFLLAHLAYLWAFTRVRRFAGWWLPFALYALLAGVILAALWRGVPGSLRGPVLVYVVCLAAMAAQAATVWHAQRGSDGAARGLRLALGGALFVASDALLATNRFAQALPLPGLWILSTYWAAQWCIASWLAPSRPRPTYL